MSSRTHGGKTHHDQISVPQIAEHASRLHEPLRIGPRIIDHDPALEIVNVEQARVCDELVLGIHLERDVRGRLSGADDARERDAAVRPRGDQALHPELPPAVKQDRAAWPDDFHLAIDVEQR